MVDHCVTEKLLYGIIEMIFCGLEQKINLWVVVTNFNRGVGMKKDVKFCNVNERPFII